MHTNFFPILTTEFVVNSLFLHYFEYCAVLVTRGDAEENHIIRRKLIPARDRETSLLSSNSFVYCQVKNFQKKIGEHMVTNLHANPMDSTRILSRPVGTARPTSVYVFNV